MRVHHLDCGSLSCLGGALAGGRGHPLRRTPMVCHVLLVETNEGLVLVDTGVGTAECEHPDRLSLGFRLGLAPALSLEVTALAQVQARGFKPEDVRHIVLTHLDVDHAGGLPDFPNATVHVMAREKEAAIARKTLKDRARYLPAQWQHDVRWETYAEGGESWLGFDKVHALRGLPDVLMVPLAGHTVGHAGIAVRSGSRWFFHCGDAYFAPAHIHPNRGSAPSGVAFFEKSIAADLEQMRANQERLRAFVRTPHPEVDVFCAHDVKEFESLRAASVERALSEAKERVA